MRKLTKVLLMGALLAPFTSAYCNEEDNCGMTAFDMDTGVTATTRLPANLFGVPSPSCMAAILCSDPSVNGGIHLGSSLAGLFPFAPGAAAICNHPGIIPSTTI